MTGEAFYDAPCGRVTGELNLKRQYEIKNGTLEYFFDSDVQIVDEFLRQLLSQNTTAKMKAIVETIQHEQDVVIRDMENDLLMVQGVAGSGKTSKWKNLYCSPPGCLSYVSRFTNKAVRK